MKKKKDWSLPIIIIVIGLMLFVMGGKDLLVLRKDPIDVMEANPAKLKAGDHVIVNVSLVWDEVISVTETTKTYGVTTSSRESDRYYALPYLYEATVDGETFEVAEAEQFILLKMSSNYFDKMTRAMDNTNEWYDKFWEVADYDTFTPSMLPPKPAAILTIEGQLSKLKSEEMGYARDYIEWLGYETTDDFPTLESYIVPYYIDPIPNPGACVGLTIAGAAILLVGILVLVFKIRSWKEEKEMEAVLAVQKPRVINTEDEEQPAPLKVSFNNSLSSPGTNSPAGVPGAAGASAPGAAVYGASAAGAASPASGTYGASSTGAAAPVSGTFGASSAESSSANDTASQENDAAKNLASFGMGSSSPAMLPLSGSVSVNTGAPEPTQLPLGGAAQATTFTSAPKPLPMGGGSSEIKHLGADAIGSGSITPAAPAGSGTAGTENTSSASGPYMGGPYMGGSFMSSSTPTGPSAPLGPSPMGSSVLTGRIALPTDQPADHSSSDGDKNDSN